MSLDETIEIERPSEDEPPKKSKKWLWIGIAAAVVVLAGAYVVAYFVAGNQLPRNAEIAGIAVGGKSPDEATALLESELGEDYEQPVKVTAESGATVELKPTEVGLSPDYDQAIEDAGGGFSWNPVHIFRSLFGGQSVEMPIEVDDEVLANAVAEQADAFTVEGQNATLAFKDGEIVTTEGTNAAVLDQEATIESITVGYQSRIEEVGATLTEEPPPVTDEMVAEAVESFAEPAISGPITITAGDAKFEITAEQIAATTTFEVEGEKLEPVVDGQALVGQIKDQLTDAGLTEAKDASYEMSGGSIVVVPAQKGETVDAGGLSEAVITAATASGEERTAAVELVEGDPEFTTEDAEAVKPKEVIGEFTTSFPHAAYRNTNLGTAANKVNGTILMPGETFSLNDTLGERTAANGYTDGYVINGGVLVKESGGGISQAATTLYNAGFFAGYEDVEHKPHSLYFDRYPAGREATIYYGSFDMAFKNDTEYPAYIQGIIKKSTSGSKGSLTFKIWSIKTYDKVESTELVKSGYYSGTTRTVTDSDCQPQSPIQGFTVNWSRLFYNDGEVVKKEDYSWKYSAGDRIVCG